MYCKNCGQELNENQDVCLGCGFKKGNGNKYCPSCGSAVKDPGQEICINCGAKLRNSDLFGDGSANLAGQNKWVMAIVCFLLGTLGIHNFIMGENKKGIFKIVMTCLCGIGFIFMLIDFVRILTDSYVADPTKLV